MQTQEIRSRFVPSELSCERTIRLNGAPDQVFPLFEPLNEKLWVEGWDPEILFPGDGQAVEHMIFRTRPRFAGEEAYRWVLTHRNTETRRIEYMVSSGERIWFVRVVCSVASPGTTAVVGYSYIGLSPSAHRLNQLALEAMFQYDLKDWEDAINAYLASIPVKTDLT